MLQLLALLVVLLLPILPLAFLVAVGALPAPIAFFSLPPRFLAVRAHSHFRVNQRCWCCCLRIIRSSSSSSSSSTIVIQRTHALGCTHVWHCSGQNILTRLPSTFQGESPTCPSIAKNRRGSFYFCSARCVHVFGCSPCADGIEWFPMFCMNASVPVHKGTRCREKKKSSSPFRD